MRLGTHLVVPQRALRRKRETARRQTAARRWPWIRAEVQIFWGNIKGDAAKPSQAKPSQVSYCRLETAYP